MAGTAAVTGQSPQSSEEVTTNAFDAAPAEDINISL